MDRLKEQLNNAVEWFGTSDIVTKMISQKLDKLIVEEMRCRDVKAVY